MYLFFYISYTCKCNQFSRVIILQNVWISLRMLSSIRIPIFIFNFLKQQFDFNPFKIPTRQLNVNYTLLAVDALKFQAVIH